jgi:putative peptide zinc metalloprotease protein
MNPIQLPIGYRLRRDIAWHSHVDRRSMHPTWIATDPLTRRIFRCGDQEHRLLHWLDSESTYESVRDKFDTEFAPQTIDLQQMRSLIARCHESGMLRSVTTKQNTINGHVEIWPTSRSIIAEQMRLREVNWFMMSIRWLGSTIGKLTQMQISLGSPDGPVGKVAPKLGWLYSGAAACFWLGLLGIAMVLIGLRFDVFLSELPDLQSLRSPAFLVGYGLIFVLTRFIHEFGHAVVCKRAGASCKDAGLIVSFGMLCPYVDITDAWKIGSRAQRIGIALAGIYTECVLAFFAALLWLATHPGWAHDLALQTLLVCTVTTLLFNANPLMKYDGYFVLCDWLHLQKLRERSFETIDAMLDGRARRGSTGLSLFLSVYFLASTLNRVLLVAGLVTMVYYVASQWQLAGLGLGLIVLYGCCWAITTMAAWTLNKNSSVGNRKMRRRTAWLGWTAVSLLIAWAVNMPLPSRAYSNGTFSMGNRQPVYTTLPGRIDRAWNAAKGMRIESQELILALTNPALQKKGFELQSRLTRIDGELETQNRAAYFDVKSVSKVPLLESQRAIGSAQWEQRQAELSQLIVSAPIAIGLGTTNAGSVLSDWVSESSIGRQVDRGTLIGWIVQDQSARVECTLNDEQIAGIRIGMEARVCIAQEPTTIYTGRVVEMATASFRTDASSVGHDRGVGHDIKQRRQVGELSPMWHQVRIELNEQRAWAGCSSGNAEVVFIKPSQSIFKMAMDKWMRDSKMR